MFPKAKRIPKDLFSSTKLTQSLSSHLITIRFSSSAKEQRFACIISKKIAKTAVARNLLKRRIFSILGRCHLPTYYFFIYPKKEAVTASFKELETDLGLLCGKIR